MPKTTDPRLCSWLSPTGKFQPLTDGHHEDAKAIISKKGYKNRISWSSIQVLFAEGWSRVSYVGDCLLVNNEKRGINPVQRRALKNLAIETHMSCIEFDSGLTNMTIWKDD